MNRKQPIIVVMVMLLGLTIMPGSREGDIIPCSPQAEKVLKTILQEARDKGDNWHDYYKTYRDQLHGAGISIYPCILFYAQKDEHKEFLDLLVMVLADVLYPPAVDFFFRWLDNPDKYIRFISACTLDDILGKPFNIGNMINKGWVQYEKLDRTIPNLKKKWKEEGHKHLKGEKSARSEK